MNFRWLYLSTALLGWLLVLPALAQNTTVTYDDVMRVAARLYCPICENEPLDECRNATCLQWKSEIQRQLEAGRSDDEIVTYFVETYGQHVVGIPQDRLLRFISFVMPITGTLIALIFGIVTFRRWQSYTPVKQKLEQETTATAETDEDYRTRLEQDLS